MQPFIAVSIGQWAELSWQFEVATAGFAAFGDVIRLAEAFSFAIDQQAISNQPHIGSHCTKDGQRNSRNGEGIFHTFHMQTL